MCVELWLTIFPSYNYATFGAIELNQLGANKCDDYDAPLYLMQFARTIHSTKTSVLYHR